MALAARGACNFDSGTEAVGDADAVARLRRRARGVVLLGFALALALTAAALLIPEG